MLNNGKKQLTVCYFGTYTPEYSRNRILISGLRENDIDVIECQTVRWGFLKYIDLAIKHWKIRNKYDVMIVGFQGIQAVILAKLLTRKTIIFDAFASLYDSMVMDRKNVKMKSFTAKYYWWLDKISMILADIIFFEILGWGPEKEKIIELFNHLKPRNLFFTGGIDKKLLRDKIVEAEACLGIFGNTDKTKRVIPNNVYECVAMRKPVVTADTPATRELFEEGELMFVKVADHISLANAIMTLKNNRKLADSIAQMGYQKFLKFATPKILGKQLLEIIKDNI